MIQAAKTFKADVVVIGSHRHTAVRGLIGGSVTQTVTNESESAVLLVH